MVVVTTEEGEFPLTGILRCPKCGAGMVTSRTTNKLADGNKKRIAYYACGNWKNKCTTVCNSNTIRADKANKYVFSKLSELLSNEKMVKIIVNNVNKEKVRKVNPAKKDLSKIDNELEKLDKKRAKLFEAPYEFIKSILENFSKVLTERYENVDFEFGKEFNIYISKSISYKVFVSEFEKNILFYEEIKKALQFMKKDFEELIGSRVNFNINEGYFDNSANTINGFKSHELSKKRKSKHK
nr:zinc ribbon domain-containing protein [Clostridium sp.]